MNSNNEPAGKRTRNVADAYAYSCNTYFAQLGIEVGAERLTVVPAEGADGDGRSRGEGATGLR